jgi:phosphate transport system ATP-binding protein
MTKLAESKLSTQGLNLYFGNKHVLKGIDIDIPKNQVTALVGPSGCGKSTLLRSFNRMHDLVPHAKIQGKVLLDNQYILAASTSVVDLRKRVGMVFQKPNPLPKSIYENLAYALKIHGFPKSGIPGQIEAALKESFLWEEVKEELQKPAVQLSGGQQQRLCIARAVVLRPEVILMDEPCSALDPISTRKIEDLILSLKDEYTIVIVTHNMQQAQRISDRVGFMYLGELIEFGSCEQIFQNPQQPLTQNYVSGHFG